MQALLTRLGLPRAEVIALAPPAAHGREAYVSEALRPGSDHRALARAADRARICRARRTTRSARSRLIEAANAEEEALAIAIALREAIETPQKTAALVTPDRALARRVVAALGTLESTGRRFRR